MLAASGLRVLLALTLALVAGCRGSASQRAGATPSSASGSADKRGNARNADNAASGAAASTASGGCKKAPGPVGERQLAVNARTGLYIVSLPKTYDSAKAYPLGFAFHGRNRNHKDCQQGDCAGFQEVMGESAVLVYMQSLREPLDSLTGG